MLALTVFERETVNASVPEIIFIVGIVFLFYQAAEERVYTL